MKKITEAKFIESNTSGIYLIYSPSGLRYVGQSKCLKSRLIDHKCPSRKYRGHPISNEFLNYSFNDFNFEILELCEPVDLNSREEYWIEKLKPELNISTGGYAASGHKVSEQVKNRLSDCGKKQWESKKDDEKEKIIKFNLTGRKPGFSHSDEVREKISQTLTGKKQSELTVKKRAESMKISMLGNSNGNKAVCSYRNGEFVMQFDNIKIAANHVGIHPSGISKAIKSGKKCAGFNWKLLGE